MGALGHWILLLALEVGAGINAALVFTHLERSLAGYVAGTVFLAVGIYALYLSFKKSLGLSWLNVFVTGVYLGLFTVPLWVARVLTPYGQNVTQVAGVPMYFVHTVSTYTFYALFVMTLIQVGWAIKLRFKP